MTSVNASGIEWEGKGGIRMPSELSWESDCPMMVRITFGFPALNDSIEWVFGRDLLIVPLTTNETTGDGDLRVEVLGDDITLYLKSPFGEARLTTRRDAVHEFVKQTLNFVPQDEESERLPLSDMHLSQVMTVWEHTHGRD